MSLHAHVVNWWEKQLVLSHRALRRKISDPWIFKWGHLKNKDRQTKAYREIIKLYFFFFLRDYLNQGYCEIYWGMVHWWSSPIQPQKVFFSSCVSVYVHLQLQILQPDPP